MLAKAQVVKSDFPLWQLQIALSFIAVVSAHLSVKSIYPKWFQETW